MRVRSFMQKCATGYNCACRLLILITIPMPGPCCFLRVTHTDNIVRTDANTCQYLCQCGDAFVFIYRHTHQSILTAISQSVFFDRIPGAGLRHCTIFGLL